MLPLLFSVFFSIIIKYHQMSDDRLLFINPNLPGMLTLLPSTTV